MRRRSWYTRRCWGGWVCSACRRERCLCRGEIYLLSASYEWSITEKIESDSSPCLKRTNQSFSFSPHTPRVPGPDHLGGLCWTCSCLLIALLRWRDSKLDTALQVQPPQREAGRNNNFSHSAVCAFADVNRNAVWLHYCGGTLLTRSTSCSPGPLAFFCRAASQSASPQSVLVWGVTSSQVQESAIALVKLHSMAAHAVPLNHNPAYLPAYQMFPPVWCPPWKLSEYAQSHTSIWWTRWFGYFQPLKTHEI